MNNANTDPKKKILTGIRVTNQLIKHNCEKIEILTNHIIHDTATTNLTEEELRDIQYRLHDIYQLIQPCRYKIGNSTNEDEDSICIIEEADNDSEIWSK